ncbi:unnamed protein product [Moneuplotes crassus]|uniref:Uncharacterized protein n=2 Tax=Euplotes crassus TaxID=5936 RepID=A0AAD1UDE7_EUPCR|nr:unnamed protein product [Moneuplotes crassus]
MFGTPVNKEHSEYNTPIAPSLKSFVRGNITIIDKKKQYQTEPFVRGDYDALSYIIKELTKFEQGSMEYGYDVDFPKLYQPKYDSKRKYSSNLMLSNKSVNANYSLSPARNYLNPPKEKIVTNDNKLSNLSTIVPRVSSSNEKLVDEESYVSKNSISPHQKFKLPALTSLNNYKNVSLNKKISVRSRINERADGSQHSTGSKHSKYSKKALDMTHEINYTKIVDESDSLHEFIIITLSKAFKAKPRPSEGLLDQDSFKFLTVAVVKGRKKESNCIRKWYKMLMKSVKRMVDVILNENPQRIQSQIYNMLNVAKVGLFSQDAITVRLTCELLLRIISEFSQTFYLGYFWEWIKSQDQVLKFLIDNFERHPEISHTTCQFLIKIAYNHLEELFMKHILKICDSDVYKYLEVLQGMMVLMKNMSDDYPDIEGFFLSGLVQTSWIDYLVSHLKNDASDPNSIRQICMTFLGEIISTFKCEPSKVDIALESIFEASQTPWKLQQMTAFTVLFDVLCKFAATKNPHSGKIYNFLAQSISNYHNDENLREFLLSNMKQILEENSGIPVEIVVAPLIAKIKKFLDDTYYLNNYDFDFLEAVVNHKKLTLCVAIKVCKTLAWLSVKKTMYHKLALHILMLAVNRFAQSEKMSNFVTKLLKYFFTVLYEIEKHVSGLSHKPDSVLNDNLLRHNNIVIMNNTLFPGRGVTCEFDPSLTNEQKKILKRIMCHNVVVSLLDVENSQLQERGIIILRSMMSKLKFKYSLKPDWIESLKRRIRENAIPDIGSSLKMMQAEIDQPIVMRKNPNKLKLANRALDEYLVEDVINDHELETDVQDLSSEGYLKHDMSSHNNSEQNSERFISFLSDKDKQKREAHDKKLFMQRLRMEFTTFSLPKEDTPLRKELDALFAAYKRDIVKLFKNYSATKEFDKKNEFDKYKPLKNRMNPGEACRMLRDRTISEHFLIPDEAIHIIREVNSILGTPQEECHYLTLQGLEIFLLQIAVHISRKYFYRKGKTKSLLENIERLFRRMSLSREEREIGLNDDLDLYEETVKIRIKTHSSHSPVKEYIRAKMKTVNPAGRNSALRDASENQNLTYSAKKRQMLLDKLQKEKEAKKLEKLRELKRLKRRKELEQTLQQRRQTKTEMKRYKFDGEIQQLEKAKKKIKKAIVQKEKFLKNIKDKVEEEQDYDRLVFRVLEDEERQKEREIQRKKALYSKEWLRERRDEFDKKYSNNKSSNRK